MEKMFLLKCETMEMRAPLRNVTVKAATSEEAIDIFNTSRRAPFPQMREKGYVPISITQI